MAMYIVKQKNPVFSQRYPLYHYGITSKGEGSERSSEILNDLI